MTKAVGPRTPASGNPVFSRVFSRTPPKNPLDNFRVQCYMSNYEEADSAFFRSYEARS